MARFEEPIDKLDRLIRNQESEVRKAFFAVYAAVESKATMKALIGWIERGDFEELFDYINEIADRHLGSAVDGARNAGLRSVQNFISDNLNIHIDYNNANLRGLSAHNRHKQDLIREFSLDQRVNVRTQVRLGLQNGENPVSVARRVRNGLTLTEFQSNAVNNFRRMLSELDPELFTRKLRDKRNDPRIKRAMASGERLPPEYIEKATQRYKERYIAYRARTIARTEGQRALNVGRQEMMEEAVATGSFQGNEIRRRWITAVDGRERDSHRALNGEERGMNEYFKDKLMYPLDPAADAAEVINCRCRLRMIIISGIAGF